MLSRQDGPNPSAAPVQKLRIRYAKRGKLRFTSHRDVARAFERAVRRAGVPMAYSQGFSPHPRISWVGAAPTGAASEAEYVEIAVVTKVDPAALARELDAALPPGLDLLEVVPAGPGSLPERIDASRWRIEVPGVSAEALRTAVDRLTAAGSVEVERLTKNGKRRIDARAAIVTLRVLPPQHGTLGPAGDLGGTAAADAVSSDEPCGILEAVVRQTTPTVRPDDVLSALSVVAALTPPVPAKATRMAQGRLDDDGRLADPLALDKGLASLPAAGGASAGVARC